MLPTTTPAPLPADRLADLGDTVCVWAHPDDETYLCGGTMAALRSAGHRVLCITATQGERGGSGDPRAVASLRAGELARALAVLGVHEHRWLGLPDGGCDEVPAGPVVARLEQLLRTVQPRTVLTFGPDGLTGHPDHRAVARWTAEAFARAGLRRARLLTAGVTTDHRARFGDLEERLGVHVGEPAPPSPSAELAVHAVLDGDLLEAKVAALAAQASQTAALRRDLGEDLYRAWVATEAFRAAEP
jgi:LmbE family N-acetylglucosaminyl deacetylase